MNKTRIIFVVLGILLVIGGFAGFAKTNNYYCFGLSIMGVAAILGAVFANRNTEPYNGTGSGFVVGTMGVASTPTADASVEQEEEEDDKSPSSFAKRVFHGKAWTIHQIHSSFVYETVDGDYYIWFLLFCLIDDNGERQTMLFHDSRDDSDDFMFLTNGQRIKFTHIEESQSDLEDDYASDYLKVELL